MIAVTSEDHTDGPTKTRAEWVKLFERKTNLQLKTNKKHDSVHGCQRGKKKQKQKNNNTKTSLFSPWNSFWPTWHLTLWVRTLCKSQTDRNCGNDNTHRMGFGKQSDSFQETGLCGNSLWYLARSVCFVFQLILILKDCRASRPAGSRLEAGFYTLREAPRQGSNHISNTRLSIPITPAAS